MSLGLYRALKKIVQGQFLSRVKQIKNLPFLIYISFLGLLIVHFSNTANTKVYTRSLLQQELNDLTIKYRTIKFQLTQRTQYSAIKNKAIKLGLHQDNIPPKLIIYNAK